jgi:phasin family protein
MSDSPDERAAGSTSAAQTIRDILSNYRLPGIDLDAFIQARRDDIDAISRATAVAFTGAQDITGKQAELLKAALGELSQALTSRQQSATDAGAEPAAAEKQRELVQNTLSRTLDGMKDMADAAQRAQSEIFDIALERARSNAEQLRSILKR